MRLDDKLTSRQQQSCARHARRAQRGDRALIRQLAHLMLSVFLHTTTPAARNLPLPRSLAGTFSPHEVLNAVRAASTALSTSAALACAMSSRCSPVAGFTVGNVSAALVHLLLL